MTKDGDGQQRLSHLVCFSPSPYCSPNRWHRTPSATALSSHTFRSPALRFHRGSRNPRRAGREPSGRLLARSGRVAWSPYLRGQCSLVPDRMDAAARPSASHGDARLLPRQLLARSESQVLLLLNERFDPHSAKSLTARWPPPPRLGARPAASRRAGDGVDLAGSGARAPRDHRRGRRRARRDRAPHAGASFMCPRRWPAQSGRGRDRPRAPAARSGTRGRARGRTCRDRRTICQGEAVVCLGHRRAAVPFLGTFDAGTALAAFLLQALFGRLCLLGPGWVALSEPFAARGRGEQGPPSSSRHPGAASFRAVLT